MISRLKLIAALLVVLFGCRNGVVAPADRQIAGPQITAVTVSVVSGDGQEGEVGSRLPEPVVVRVDWLYEDGTTAPAVGEKVLFVDVNDGMGRTLAYAWADSAGEVHIWWDLGTSARPYTIEAYWMNYPDCSPVCSLDVRATSGFFSAVAHAGPIYRWAVTTRLVQPPVPGSSLFRVCSCTYSCTCFGLRALIQYGDTVVADVFYEDRYGNRVAPCDTVGPHWELTEEPAGMSGMVDVDGDRLFVARFTAGIEWVPGWTAVATVTAAGCNDVHGAPFNLPVSVKHY